MERRKRTRDGDAGSVRIQTHLGGARARRAARVISGRTCCAARQVLEVADKVRLRQLEAKSCLLSVRARRLCQWHVHVHTHLQ